MLTAAIRASVATMVALIVLLVAVWAIDMVAWIWCACTKSLPDSCMSMDQHCELHHELATNKQQKQQAQHPTKDAASCHAADIQLSEQHSCSIVLPSEQYHTVLNTQQHSSAPLTEHSSKDSHNHQHSCNSTVQQHKQYSNVLPSREQYCSVQHMPKAPLPAVHALAVEAPAGPLHLHLNALSKQQQMDVWVLAGQSNCVGTNQADGQEMPAAAQPWPGRILKFDCDGCSWQEAVPNVHLGVYGYADAYSCGPGMAFARTLVQTSSAHTVGLVPTACGGTNLFDQWAPGGLLWSNMVQQTIAALDALEGRGRLAGIMWVQGESDAFSQDTATAYAANFSNWLDATRHALQAYCPCVPLVMAVMATRQRQGAFPFIDIVTEQQWGLKLPHLLKVDMAGFEFYDGGDGNLVHLTKAGCCALGGAMALEVAAWSRIGC